MEKSAIEKLISMMEDDISSSSDNQSLTHWLGEARRLCAEEKAKPIECNARKLLSWIEKYKIGPTTQSLKVTFNDGMTVMRDIVHAKVLSIIFRHSEEKQGHIVESNKMIDEKPTAPSSLVAELREAIDDLYMDETTRRRLLNILSRYQPSAQVIY